MKQVPIPDRPELGQPHLWYWRGWRIRYTALIPTTAKARQATPLLLIHGFGASLEQWRQNLIPLSQDRPVYALDLLGFGGSQKPATLVGTDLWQSQVYDFWQALIQQPVILLGHSLGGLVALAVTVAHPKMVSRLVMLTLPLARQELISGWLETLSRHLEAAFATPLLMRPLFQLVRRPWFIQRVLRQVYVSPNQVDAELVALFTRPTQDRGAARALCYLVRSRTEPDFSPAVRDLIPQVSIPMLLIWGKADRVSPFIWSENLPALNPNLTLVGIDDAGHCLYDEAPETVQQVFEQWLGG